MARREGQPETGRQPFPAGREGGEVADTEGFDDWIKERKWTSDRARRIMQRHSERLMGTKLNISAWRNMAIAISNRYLHDAFKEAGFGEEDDDGIEDNPADLQAGHGTHVAGLIYARQLQQGGFGTAAMREQFRAISREWHQFLGFGAEDWTGAGEGGKRRRAGFEAEREEARFRRFARLSHTDVRGQLRQMMGDETEFRGRQQEVIRSIVRGESPIVQITGTGGGKMHQRERRSSGCHWCRYERICRRVARRAGSSRTFGIAAAAIRCRGSCSSRPSRRSQKGSGISSTVCKDGRRWTGSW
ncbi:hypothetical protein HIM_09198 [Hirsutella minnesotensis 3608]|uniref:Peptidase S8/S53 domain-containing protein n=1 Tax=Hirsutella minnesotensis 3608 TaxID=1043627 RepID=A0A0F7ZLS3_9HYPO|nr:hypothetical protein HIM_09198 [Hirsutella minnesotensis 3608]